MWDDAEEKFKKKIRKITKNSAKAAGGGVALWVFSLIYPRHEGAEDMAALLGDIGIAVIVYGLTMIGFIAFNQKLAPIVNIVLTWLILPGYVIYLLMNAQSG